jgi:anti-sigma regulatory factor (Ser/Thr protein kinase)
MQITELITNAIEHGNLGITYDEKTEFVAKGTWSAEVDRRLALPQHQKKMVSLTFSKSAHGVTVLIEDEGPGFDYSRYVRFDESRAFDNHGRGIAIAGSLLDLQFLGRGNRVLVTIREEKPGREAAPEEPGA